MIINGKRNYMEQLIQLTTVTWDGDLICKSDRDRLVKCGYAEKVEGYNFITAKGIIVLDNLGMIRF